MSDDDQEISMEQSIEQQQHEMSPTVGKDGIRRSKRKKFQLDFVAAAHGENQKKSKRDFGESGDDDEDEEEEEEELENEDDAAPESPDNDEDDKEEEQEMEQDAEEAEPKEEAEDEEEEEEEAPEGEEAAAAPAVEEEELLGRGRRARRSTAGVMHGYQQDIQELEIPHNIGGMYFCPKCPISYNNKSSLANHSKMHNGGVLRFACELCDFSATTIKSLNNHSVIHQKFGVLSPQISPAAPGASTSSGASSSKKQKTSGKLNTSIESSTSSTSAPQLAAAAAVKPAEEPPVLESEESEDDEDDGPPILEREVPESSSDDAHESSVRKSGRAPKPTPKVLEKKTRGPYKKKNKQLTVDSDGATSSESGQNSPILSGSMPTSSSSSVTPPPSQGSTSHQKSHKKTQPTTPPASRETSEEAEAPVVKSSKKKGRVQCKHCPYACSSPSRLARHMQGHLLREGYICPVDGCLFMCRKQGFIAKHYILHGRKLPSSPKYCRKTLKGNKWFVEECEDPLMVSLNLSGDGGANKEEDEEEEEMEMDETATMMDSTTDSVESAGDVTAKEVEPVQDDVQPSTSTSQEKSQKQSPKKKAGPQKRKLEKTPPPKKMVSPMKKVSPMRLQKPPVSQAEMRAMAQIKSHKNVIIDTFPYKQCNVGVCQFRTATVAQIMAHKIHTHGAMDSFPLHQYLCYKCGYRTYSDSQLRIHKIHTHLTNRHRFERLFYLKELVGDKFFIRHWTVNKPLLALPPAEEPPTTPTKQEAPPTLVAEVMVESVDVVKPMMQMAPVKQEIIQEEMEECDEDDDDDDDDDGDRSFDSEPGSSNQLLHVPMIGGPMIFCCNSCPYKSLTTNRTERHHAKHFVKNAHQCPRCTWSCRTRKVLVAHIRMHDQAEQEEREKAEAMAMAAAAAEAAEATDSEQVKMEMLEPEIKEPEPEEEEEVTEPPKLHAEEPSEDTEDSEKPKKPTTLDIEIQTWCIAEKAKRPELDESFTRKMIDSVKGFQCSDCPYTSKYRGDMRSHKKRHDIEQSFRCVMCTYTTNRPVSLKDHLKQHAVVTRAIMEMASTSSDASASSRFQLSQAIRTSEGVHLGTRYGLGKDRFYACARCPFVTVVLSCLWRHNRNHREKPRVNVCSNCTYSSLDSKKMDEHLLIHLSLGAHLNEQIPFVKRVDYQGRPVSSLMDLGEKRTPAKRKLEKAEETVEPVEEVSEDEEEEEMEIQSKPPKRNQRVQRIKEEDKEFRPSTSNSPKRRKMSTEPSPEPETSAASQPTRQLSERATRNRINYSLLSRNGSGKPTPSSSSANLEGMIAAEVQEQENELARLADEPHDISHWRIRSVLNKEFGGDLPTKCSECPYKTSDPEVLEKHRYYHTQKANGPRPYVCSDCSFNTYTPTALLQHLKLHSDGFMIDPMVKQQRLQKHQKKGDVIPPGVEGFYCRNCPYKTANKRAFNEHVAYHRHLLINRMMVSLKRQPPKEDYQRPKLKHQFVARNAKYCKKCTFKCVSHSSFIEHLDRHGWDQLYKCHICDYSDNNKSVVSFHELTHHIVRDQTLHGINQASKFRLENGKILKAETAKLPPTPEEFVIKSRGLMKCSFCDYFCHVSSELAFHMTVNHLNEPNAEETISHLSMGLIPPQASVTTV